MTKTTQYKNTPIGPIPKDWEVRILKEIANIKGRIGYRGYTVNDIVDKDSGAVTISPSNFSNGSLDIKDSTYISWNKYYESPEIMVRNNDILLVKTGSTYGKSCLVSNLTKSATINPQIVIIKEVNQDIKYLSYIVSDKIFQNQISKIVVGGAIPTLSQEAILKFSIPLPPLPEQQKIAEVLSTWDKAIQDTDAIIKKLEDRNKALAFSLLTGKKRVKGFEDKEFIKSLANEVFKSVSIKNNPEDSILLSANQEFGMIPRDMIETRVTMPSGSLKTYKLVEKGDFVISLRSFQGGIEYSEYTGVVSPAYTVLKSINPINDDFYKYYFKSEDLIGRLSVAVIGIRDGKNISYDDFSTIVLPNPSLEEQNAIAEILNTANQEVKYYQQKLEALKLQKKGLMQQLLTGKVRTV